MTRLDPSSHRNNARTWMEEARNRDSFARRSSVPHGSSKVDKDRESGFFSLGRVAGAQTLRDKSPSPHRHAERGHPLPSSRMPEPKAAIPFRNPDLGVPSQRRTSEIQNPDLAPVPVNSSPEPVDLSIEVEAQAGPRSLSPTPFKQAESLAASQKRGFRASNSSLSQFGNVFSSTKDSHFSHSSSPSRSSSPFKRTESVTSLSSRGYKMDNVSERRDHQSKSPNRDSFGQPDKSETARKNFRSFASTVGAVSNLTKSQSSPYADLKAGLRKTEHNGLGTKTQTPSFAKQNQDASGQSLLRKTETKNFSNNQKKSESRNSSPSRSSSQSILKKVVEGWRSASPVRKGYGTASQPEKSLISNKRSHNSSSPSKKSFEVSSLSLHKSDTKRHSSPARRSNDAPTKQTLLHKSVSDRSSGNRSPSPSKRSYDPPGQSHFKSEHSNFSGSIRSSGNRSPSPSKRGYDPPGQSHFKSDHSNFSGSIRSSGNRSPSPSKRGYDPPGQSHFKSEHSNFSGSIRSSGNRSPSPSKRGYDPPGQSHFKSEHSNYSGSIRSSGNRSPSPSKRGYDPPGQSHFKSEHSNFSGSIRSYGNRNPSPSKRGYDPPGQSHFKSEHSNYSGSNRSSGTRSPSQSKRSFDPPGQSHFKSEHSNYSGSNRSSGTRSPSPSKRGYDPPGQSHFKSEHSNYSGSNRSSGTRSPSPSKRSFDPPGQSHFRSEHSNYSGSNRSGTRSPSPSKQSYDPPGQSLFKSEHSERGRTIIHKTVSEPRFESMSHMRKSTNSSIAGSWRGSTHSLDSPPISRNPSPTRKSSESRLVAVQKSAHVSWSTSDRKQGQDKHSSSCRNRSPSPLMRNHTSSQSSIDSIMSSGSSGLNREEYVIMADLPKDKRVLQRTRPNQREETEKGNRDETSLYKPASHSHTKAVHITWDDMTDQRGNTSPTHTPSQTQGGKMEQGKDDKVHQPDLLNFKKGWMSKLDENGEWKKHWFVLTDAGLKYYRDSGAEEKDELDGEIDLRSCLKVSEFDVEKNYGFQIQTASGVFTLSAMTAGIRRNWIEVLRKNIRPSITPDLTQLPDSSSDKEASRHQSSRRQSETSSTPAHTQRRFDYVELSPVATPTLSAPTNQREAGEGQVREHGQGHEDKSRSVQRESVTSRKWPGKTPEQKQLEEEIERKWEEFERLPLKPTVSLSALGSLQRWHL
ncbi:TRIO and F-actin binding protein b isoform X2 [Tachysurus fulvidraco]|uniref:TRIO and F-actin binding protein b isoform X2 n=1 Tax=Tachysurus fulvidraco TaxID=1234273 RepID=UPI001FF063BC|nr:TRIO and F-actin binding protein b isoform X2 [Tachysurus fulvidraco]